MLKRAIAAGFVFSFILQAGEGHALEKLKHSVVLSKSGESAQKDEPECSAGGLTTADTIIQGIQSVSLVAGEPILAAILSDPARANWVKERLGIHDGKSICQTACFTLPKGVNFEANITVSPQGWSEVWTRDNPWKKKESWSIVEGPSISSKDSTDLICFQLKNWKHDKDRTYLFNIYY